MANRNNRPRATGYETHTLTGAQVRKKISSDLRHVQGGKIRRYWIDDFAEVYWTESGDDNEEANRFWITVSQDSENFYKVPEDLRESYR
jgi:hypothetical protein